MRHCIKYTTCNVGEEEIKLADIKGYVIENSDGHQSLQFPIRWIDDKIFSNYNAALNYIHSINNGCYDQIAVKYKEPKNDTTSTRLETLNERRDKAYLRLLKCDEVHYKNIKSEFMSCKECKSRLATKYINSNNCPVCHAELRPKKILDRRKSVEKNLEKINNEIFVEREKLLKDNYTLMWLIKYEFHC